MIIGDYSRLHDYPLIIEISMGRRRRIGTYIQLPEGQASSLKVWWWWCLVDSIMRYLSKGLEYFW